MLQVLIEKNDKYSLTEVAQMAIEAECSWLVLAGDTQETERRESFPDIVEMCRQSGVMLSVENQPEVAKEYGMHGVFISLGGPSPIKIREELGPEAVVGAEVGASSVAAELARADIDYVSLPENLPVEEAASVIAETRLAGVKIPFVARCKAAEDADVMMAAGFSGICCGKSLYESGDPVENIASLRRHLMKEN